VTRVKGWSDASYVQLHQLVRQLGNKWTVIGSMMDKTPYVCSAAYKRLLDRLSTAEREGNEQLLRLFDKDDGGDDDDDGGGDDDDYSPPPPSSPINASSSSIQTAVWSRSEDERLKLLVGSLGRKWQVKMMMMMTVTRMMVMMVMEMMEMMIMVMMIMKIIMMIIIIIMMMMMMMMI
jgi:hypothetical protein